MSMLMNEFLRYVCKRVGVSFDHCLDNSGVCWRYWMFVLYNVMCLPCFYF
jgi:hypothetical protein